MLRTVILTLLCLLMSLDAAADERILAFHSDIVVASDGSMEVTETIRVRAEGNQIQRGIYRDFPTDYEDRLGNRIRVDFQVLEVYRDDYTEPYHQERLGNGVRLYIGSARRYLQPDEYTYRIRYRTDRQLGFFDLHDELYWNVTGNGWAFPIDAASASVSLPAGISPEDIHIEGYVGYQGTQGQEYAVAVTSDATANITATRHLGPREGLTLVVTWPKGFVPEPTWMDKTNYLLADNIGLSIALLAAGTSFLWLFYAWLRAGRDPKPGVIFPHYEPPDGFPPASMRFISRMAYDKRTFTAALVNLAVKGFVDIDESGKTYTLSRCSADESSLAPGEAALLEKLFEESDVVELDDKNHAVIGGALKAHAKTLTRYYHKKYFFKNTTLIIPAWIMIGLGIGVILFLEYQSLAIGAVLVVALIMSFVFAYLMKAPTKKGRRLLDKIEGFKSYLEVAEKDDLNLRNPPEKTPQLFEAYLPYALALAVEQPWAEQFADVFARLRSETGEGYQPRWYHGRWNSYDIGNFTSDMSSSLSSAIASSASPPGSSSGGGGGGSSGGGGGGGGGGGW